MFFRDLKALNHRGRCRGWKCGCKASPWPCSVVSAIEFAIKNEDAQLLSESILPCQLLLVKKIRSDERWKDAVENLEFSDV